MSEAAQFRQSDRPRLDPLGLRRIQLVRQSEAAECGLACLAMVASYYGLECDIISLRSQYSISLKGMNARTLMSVARSLGLEGRGLRCEPKDLERINCPAILHWNMDHFVVVERVSAKGVILLDPAAGRSEVPWSTVHSKFTGIAIELWAGSNFKRRRLSNPLRLSSILNLRSQTVVMLLKASVAAAVVETCLLLAPLYFNLVIDQVIARGDIPLLWVIVSAFALLAVFELVGSVIKALSVQGAAAAMSLDMRHGLFNHLLHLPLDWFQKRHVGDIQSRFQATLSIKDVLSSGVLSLGFDLLFVVAAAVMMMIFAPILGVITIGFSALMAAVALATLQAQRKLAHDVLQNQAREDGLFLESLRAAQTLKTLGAEERRLEEWQQDASETINSELRGGALHSVGQTFASFLDRLSDVIVIAVGASAVLQSEMTIGVLTAFIAYKSMFSRRLQTVIVYAVRLKLLDVSLERLGDIALSKQEENIEGHAGLEPEDNEEFSGEIELRNVSYRYGFGDKPVLSQVSVKIKSGDFVAITGPSGAGKSTLVKIMVGLLDPLAGQVLVGGKPIAYWGKRIVRRRVAAVMQDDELLAGSVLSNIAFGDDKPDIGQARAAARTAQIEAEIDAMPMGFSTPVGDLGSALSGGQKARILIARALYRKPTILIMDEGTAHLHPQAEIALNNAMRELEITRIVVAHRETTSETANSVWVLQGGLLLPQKLAPEQSTLVMEEVGKPFFKD